MKIMQCAPFQPHKLQYPVLGQVKIDGIFARWDENTREFYTRSGHIIQGLSDLRSVVYNLPSYDGELTIPGVPFHEMNGLLRSFKDTPNAHFWVFDRPERGSCITRLDRYYTELKKLSDPRVTPLKYHKLHNVDELDSFYHKVLKAGHEGIVLKHPSSDYYNGKKWKVQKRVPEERTELKVVGVTEGKGKYHGTFGAFITEDSKGNRVKVGMGKGVTESFRHKVWADVNKYIGGLITVSYKSVTEAGSLRQPKFVSIRWDL